MLRKDFLVKHSTFCRKPILFVQHVEEGILLACVLNGLNLEALLKLISSFLIGSFPFGATLFNVLE